MAQHGALFARAAAIEVTYGAMLRVLPNEIPLLSPRRQKIPCTFVGMVVEILPQWRGHFLSSRSCRKLPRHDGLQQDIPLSAHQGKSYPPTLRFVLESTNLCCCYSLYPTIATMSSNTDMKAHVLVLGCGLVAPPMIHYLAQHGFKQTIASRTQEKTMSVIAGLPGCTAVEFDIEAPNALGQLEPLIQQCDLVVSLLPYIHHVAAARIAIKHRKHFCTTSYVSAEMESLATAASDAGVLLLNECGVDPGLDHMSAQKVGDLTLSLPLRKMIPSIVHLQMTHIPHSIRSSTKCIRKEARSVPSTACAEACPRPRQIIIRCGTSCHGVRGVSCWPVETTLSIWKMESKSRSPARTCTMRKSIEWMSSRSMALATSSGIRIEIR